METSKTPAVGQIAPDFELADSTGTARRLSGLVVQNPILIVFYRGYW